jgi:diadenosine tetraphosphate (Ap4A) HIT family hydrolase
MHAVMSGGEGDDELNAVERRVGHAEARTTRLEGLVMWAVHVITRLPELPVAFDAHHRPLFQTPSWCVLLHRNQWNLGRCIVVLRTRAIDDPLALTFSERDELWSMVLPRLSSALAAASAPDRLNYAHLANRQRHVH